MPTPNCDPKRIYGEWRSELPLRYHREADSIHEWTRQRRKNRHGNSSGVQDVESRFEQLAQQWRAETMYVSSTTALAMHPAYQSIIGLGPAVVPCLLRALAKENENWFWALQSITGVNPVPEQDQGHMRRMRDAWLEWGRREGLI